MPDVFGEVLLRVYARDARFVAVIQRGFRQLIAVLKVVLRPPARDASSGVSTTFLSFGEDLVGLIGGALAIFVPFLPVGLVGFLLFFYARIRRRRGRKFGELRILCD